MTERCEVAKCRAEAAITYLDRGVCDRHWNHLTAEDAPPDALRISLGIEAPGPAAQEERTMEPTTNKTTKIEAAATSGATSKTTKPAKGAKAAAKPKSAKEPKPRKEKAPKQDLVVFAFRLPAAQRDAIHAAAGPGKATRFVLAAALAAAAGDQKAFAALVENRAAKS